LPVARPRTNHAAPEISKTSQDRPIVDTSQPAPEAGSVSASARAGNRPALRTGTKHNRILDGLRTLSAQFKEPHCPECGGLANLAISSEGPVVRCASGGCKWAERVDVHTLQRLADNLRATCYECRGTNLVSTRGPFSNYLKCRDDGANNSWE